MENRMDSQLPILLGSIGTRQWDQAWEEFCRLEGCGQVSPAILLMGSHAAFGRRDLAAARRLAESALAATTGGEPARLVGQVRFHLGMVLRELGDPDGALQQFDRFLADLPDRYPDLASAEGKAHFYRGLAMRQQGNLAGAAAAYENALALFRRDGLTTLVVKGLHNLAWVLCLMNEPLPARERLAEASRLVSDPEDQIHQTLGEALLALAEGRHATAAALCESLFRRSERERLTAAEKSQTAWIAARAALAAGDRPSAEALCDIALAHAANARDARLEGDARELREQLNSGQIGA